MNSILPRRPLLSSFTARLRAKIPRLQLASNPCRIKFFGQEIVVLREDMMARMLRNLVGVKPAVRTEELKQFVSPFLDGLLRGLRRNLLIYTSFPCYSLCSRSWIKVILHHSRTTYSP